MGNAVSSSREPLRGVGELDGANGLHFEWALGSSRFLRTARVRDCDGALVLKMFNKPTTGMRLSGLVERLVAERAALADVPNALPYGKVIETDAAAYLMRQWLAFSVYDRSSTRPFLAPIEKLWISYQMLRGMCEAAERGVHHGDLKGDNVMLTTALDVYVTDFASSFKPTYLPLDDPSDFTLFFDTSGRRTCYVAPERFYESLADLPQPADRGARAAGARRPRGAHRRVDSVADALASEPYLEALGLGRPNGAVTEAMDVFSAGCVLAEIWRDGAPTFTLSTLFRYRAGELDIAPMLAEIPDEGIRALVGSMLARAPEERPSFAEALARGNAHAFPCEFREFLHAFVTELQRVAPSVPANVPASADAVRICRMQEPDERMIRVYREWPRLVRLLGAPGDGGAVTDRTVPVSVAVPPMDAGLEHLPVLASAKQDGIALLLLNVVLSNITSCVRASVRGRTLHMLMHMTWGWLTDETRLDRVMPYLVALVSYSHPLVRASAVRSIFMTLECTNSITSSNLGLIIDYLLPNVRYVLGDPCSAVRAECALHFARFARCTERFLVMEHALRRQRNPEAATPASWDLNVDAQLERLRTELTDRVVTLLRDPEPGVSRAILDQLAPLALFFGPALLTRHVVQHLSTFLNSSDWRLRCAFFSAVVAVAPVVGSRVLEQYIQPLMLQAITDEEEYVVSEALGALCHLVQMGVLSTHVLHELVVVCTGLVCHPNEWIAQACMSLVASIAQFLPPVDTWTLLYARLRPLLQCDVQEISVPALRDFVQRPLPRPVLYAACNSVHAPNRSSFWNEEQLHVLPDPVRTMAGLPPPRIDDEALVRRLAASGFDPEQDTHKLLALRWFILHTAQQHTRHQTSQQTRWQLPPVGEGLVPETVFFQGPERVSRPSSLALVEARLELEAQVRPAPTPRAATPEEPPRREHAAASAPSTPSSTARGAYFAPGGQPGQKAPAATAFAPASAQGQMAETARRGTPAGTENGLPVTPVERASASPVEVPTDEPHCRTTYTGTDPHLHAHLERVYEKLERARGPGGDARMSHQATIAPSTAAPVGAPGPPRGPSSSAARPQGTLIAYFAEHAAPIVALAVPMDHLFFVSAARDGVIKVWDTARIERNVTAHSRVTYSVHTSAVVAMLLLTGTHCVVSVEEAGAVHVWQVVVDTSGTLPRYSRPTILVQSQLDRAEGVPTCAVQATHSTTPVVAVGTATGRVVFLDVWTLTVGRRLQNPVEFGAITAIAVDRQGAWMCIGTANGMLSLFDLRFSLHLRSWVVGEPEQELRYGIQACTLHPSRDCTVLVAFHVPPLTPGGSRTVLQALDLRRGEVVEVYEVAAAREPGDAGGKAAAQEGQDSSAARCDSPDAPSAPCTPITPIDTPQTCWTATMNRVRSIAADGRHPPGRIPVSVNAVVPGVQGYETAQIPEPGTGARRSAGFVLTGGDDCRVRFWNLGAADRGVCLGGLGDTGTFALQDAPVRDYRHSASYSEPAAHAGSARSPLATSEQLRGTSAFVKAHKDAVTALSVIERPFRCIVAGDRHGAVRVWE